MSDWNYNLYCLVKHVTFWYYGFTYILVQHWIYAYVHEEWVCNISTANILHQWQIAILSTICFQMYQSKYTPYTCSHPSTIMWLTQRLVQHGIFHVVAQPRGLNPNPMGTPRLSRTRTEECLDTKSPRTQTRWEYYSQPYIAPKHWKGSQNH